jgi:hypothetical protein
LSFDDGDKHILGAAVFQLVQHPEPGVARVSEILAKDCKFFVATG